MNQGNETKLRAGMFDVGPHTAATLLELWIEGHLQLNLREFRYLVKRLSMFLEEIEEVRGEKPVDR